MLLAGLAFSPALFAQSYLNASSHWYFEGGGFTLGVGTHYAEHHTYYLDGDTLLDGHAWYKMYFDRQDTSWAAIVGGTTVYAEKHLYYAAIREEGKKFYLVYKSDDQPFLLYDFNIQVGETLGWTACSSPVVVTGMDTVLLGTTPLQRFFLNNFPDEFIVEGVGSSMGFQVNCPGTIGIESYYDPICYGRDGHTLPLQTWVSDCSILSGTGSPQNLKSLTVMPNPSTGMVRLQGIRADQPLENLQVFDSMGNRVRYEKTGSPSAIDLSALSSGLYFLTLRAGTTLYTGKVLLMK